MTNAFQLVAGHPALDFVNTLDWRFREFGPEELLHDYNHLLIFAAQSALLTQAQEKLLRRAATTTTASEALHAALDLREALAQIFYALMDDRTPPAGAIKKLDHHVHTAQSHSTLTWNRSRLQPTWPSKPDPRLPIWMLAQSAAELLSIDAIASIRDCADPECRWLFLDTSKNHSRRWCDMKICGNRMKARRFKAQHNGH